MAQEKGAELENAAKLHSRLFDDRLRHADTLSLASVSSAARARRGRGGGARARVQTVHRQA